MKHIKNISRVIEFEKDYLNSLEKKIDDVAMLIDAGVSSYNNKNAKDVYNDLYDDVVGTRNFIFHLEERLKFYVK